MCINSNRLGNNADRDGDFSMTYQELLTALRERTPTEYNKTLLKIAIQHEPKNLYDDESLLWCDGCDKEAPCWELEDLRLGVLRAHL